MSKDIEKLLELVSEFEESKEKKPASRGRKRKPRLKPLDHTQFTRFLRYYHMEPGETTKVPNYFLEYLYFKDWDRENKELKYRRNFFFKQMSKLFKKGRRGDLRYYYIIMDVSDEKKEKAKKEYKKRLQEREAKAREKRAKLRTVAKKIPLPEQKTQS